MKSRYKNRNILTAKEQATICFYCHRPLTSVDNNYFSTRSIDHFVPICKGGINKNFNKVICCSLCNKLKADLTPDEFIEKLKGMIQFKSYHQYSKEQIPLMISQVEYLMNRENKSDKGYFLKRRVS